MKPARFPILTGGHLTPALAHERADPDLRHERPDLQLRLGEIIGKADG
ncbi:MAG: hypothetical protein R3E31_16295 [Chloroflexota bacterium]